MSTTPGQGRITPSSSSRSIGTPSRSRQGAYSPTNGTDFSSSPSVELGSNRLRPLNLNLSSPVTSASPRSATGTNFAGAPSPTSPAFKLNGLGKSLHDAMGETPMNASPRKPSPLAYPQPSPTASTSLAKLQLPNSSSSIAISPISPLSTTPTTNTNAPQGASLAPRPSKSAAPRNPLIDLIETERAYVDDLAMIIKKVAAAWSRSNFPPPALDTMFRAIEAVYRIAKQFVGKLNEIGPNPSSPKALGDLLMRWIDDLEPAYTRYVNSYMVDFDYYTPVQSNSNLQPILEALPPLSTSKASDDYRHPTLDALFQLPLDRLQYYKRLYAKLLKSTQPGKSDHGLLVSANEKLDWLLDTGRQSATRSVGSDDSAHTSETIPPPQPHPEPPQRSTSTPTPKGSMSIPNSSSANVSSSSNVAHPPKLTPLDVSGAIRRGSETPSNSGSSVQRSSGQTSNSAASTAVSSDTSTQMTPFSPSPPASTAAQLLELEKRLDTSRTLDIFSMKLKKCKLQMNPPNLPYQRAIRQTGEVQLSFIPASDPSQQEIYTPAAIIYLLTDLFLLCERISNPHNESQKTNPAADMWLMYPPLATKHLRVYKAGDGREGDTSFEVEIMKKERLFFTTSSRTKRDEWVESFREAIAFNGGAQGLTVNTDVTRSVSPASVTSAYGRGATLSGQSWRSNTSGTAPSSGNANGSASPLPPLPPSATQSNFPMSAGSSPNRSPTPSEGLGRPLDLRQRLQPQTSSPQQISSPMNGNAPPPLPSSQPQAQPQPASQYQPPYRQQSSLQPSNLPPHSAPPVQSTPPWALPSPSRQNFPLPNPHQPPNQYGQSMSQFQQHGHLPSGAQEMQVTQSLDRDQHHNVIRKQPSARSVASASSRSSSKAAGPLSAATATSPIPPLPFKDPQELQYRHHQQQSLQQQPPGSYREPPFGQQQQSAPNGIHPMHRSRSAEALRQQEIYRMPSSVFKESLRGQSLPGSQSGSSGSRSLPGSRMASGYLPNDNEDISPPPSPTQEGPVTTQLAAQMKCKVFIQQAHQQWKSLGTAKLKLYLQSTKKKQLVVEGDKAVLISTIVLEDGVERVGKTGVAIELSDNGSRTGIIYMLQLKTEQSATGLFQQLLHGSTRASALAR